MAGRVKTLWVREPYLSQILAGLKTVEVRVGYDNIRRLQAGDQLKLNDEHLVTIRRIGRYADFEELLAHEDPAAIAPDAPGQLLAALRELYPPEKEALGAIALELISPSPASGPEGRRYEAVLFDMGHTLVYFEPQERVVIQEALRAVGVERSEEEAEAALQAVFGEYYRHAATATFPATAEYDHETQLALARGLLERLGLAPGEGAAVQYAELLDTLFSRPGAMRLYPEVREVLAALQERGYRLGIVSNWSWNLRDRAAQVGLDGFFELVWASAYAGYNKPHPGIFHQALARMALAPEHALYVGDSYRHDVIGAREADLDVLLLDRQGKVAAPDCPVIKDLWGVIGWLEGG
jgi:putative hydrolase of the HAD superfamily